MKNPSSSVCVFACDEDAFLSGRFPSSRRSLRDLFVLDALHNNRVRRTKPCGCPFLCEGACRKRIIGVRPLG